MKSRDQIVAELEGMKARSANLRAEGDTDALIANTAAISSLVEEIRAHDAANAPVVVAASAPKATTTLGQEIADSGVLSRGIGASTTIQARDLFTGDTAADTAAGVAGLPTQPTSIVDLLAAVPTNSDTVEYFVQTGFTSAAAAKAAGVEFDKSEISYEKKSVPVARIGHYLVVGEDLVSDVTGLSARINGEGVRGVREAVEAQLLAPAHTANGLSSIVADAGTKAYEGSTVDAKVAAIRAAITQAEAPGHNVDVIIVSPQLREELDLASNSINGGNGIWTNGMGTLFGRRVVTSYRLPAGVDALVGSTRTVTLRPRTGIEVATSNSAEGVFLRDGVVVKVRQRVAVEVTRPDAWVKVVAD
jgi:HK97 family phage major capsid protein